MSGYNNHNDDNITRIWGIIIIVKTAIICTAAVIIVKYITEVISGAI